MKTSIAQLASNSIVSDFVVLSLDADTLEVLHAAIETSSECASAMMLRSDDAE